MKTVIKTSIGRPFLRPYYILTAIAVVLLAFSPKTRAVIPAPDGGYRGANTAEGQAALLSLTTAGYNTAIGFESLRSDTTGQFNTGVGAGTLYGNTGNQNTASGALALFSNTTGLLNTATGAFALFNNTMGYSNTANGANALQHNTTGVLNEAFGQGALLHNITGQRNTAVGDVALANSNADGNTAIGSGALDGNTIGSNNTAIGLGALISNTTGSGNIVLGFEAGNGVTTANNVICIGARGNNVSDSCYIGNIFGDTSSGGTTVFINSNGRLGTATSSRRFKDDIKPMERASEALFALKPVSFRYKKALDPNGVAQFGLVAEEVEKVIPDLVVRDKDGKPYSVRYDAVNAMLLNEFLKEHREVEAEARKVAAQARKIDAQEHQIGEQEATISELKKDLQTVVARLKEQDSIIQRVSAEVEINKRSSHVVITSP